MTRRAERWGGARRLGLAALLVGGTVGAAAGCGTTARYPGAERSVKAPARIRNLSLRTVRVYLERSGQTHLIGSVPPLASARLQIPERLARRGTRVGLLVAPVAGHRWVGQRVLIADVLVDELATEGWTVVESAF